MSTGRKTRVTEAQWLAVSDSRKVLEYLRGTRRASVRTLRLFAAASCRTVWQLLPAEESRAAVEVSERLADGLATEAERRDAEAVASKPFEAALAEGRTYVDTPEEHAAAAVLCVVGDYAPERQLPALANAALLAKHAASGVRQVLVLRDIFGLVPPPTYNFDPAWLAWHDGSVSQLARAAYEDRRLPEGTLDPARLAVLADALEDAGCTDAELLSHLRGPGPHVRGCWAVDLVLGKS
jgi:hypothetical protein